MSRSVPANGESRLGELLPQQIHPLIDLTWIAVSRKHPLASYVIEPPDAL